MNRSNIMKRVKEHYEEAQSLGHEVMVCALQGSQNYGLDIYTEAYQSDVDTKAIIVPSFEHFARDKKFISTTHVRENNEHTDLKDIREIFNIFKKQNINFVEILFTPYYVVNSEYAHLWEQCRAIAEEVTHSHPSQTLRACVGMTLEKLKALQHPYPSIADKIEKFGYDPKQLSHIVRVNDFTKRFIDGCSFADCLIPSDIEFIKRIKVGEIPLKEAVEMANAYTADTKELVNQHKALYGEVFNGDKYYDELDSIMVESLKLKFKKDILT